VRVGELPVEGPAERGGLRAGDIILTVDGVPIGGADDLMRALDRETIGRSVEIRILRTGRIETLAVIPTERVPPAKAP
jgi:S1-C subfamily serine protease